MTNPERPHLYTLEEATELMPIIEPLLREAQMKAAALQQLRQNVERTVQEKSQSNGHRLDQEKDLGEVREASEQLVQNIQQLVTDIQSFGCEVKDVLMGLLDFRAQRGDKVVYLCWRLGEPKIAYWHELDTGFADRQPL